MVIYGNKNKKKEEEINQRIQLEKYQLGRILGEGNFGKVKIAQDVESGEPFAVKIFEKNKILDLKITNQLENVLVDAKRNINISDFGLSGLPQYFMDDALLHTTCGSPNYVAQEFLKQ